MKKPKMKKLPRKPKGGTIETLKKYLQKVKGVKRENKRKESEFKKFLKLKAKIQNM